jgi:DNA-binding CsgD family transcriptional regulator
MNRIISTIHPGGDGTGTLDWTPPVAQHLTPQEVRLLGLLAEGHSYEACAGHLRISVNTVRNYIRSVYEKLDVHSKAEAVTKALRSRIIL